MPRVPLTIVSSAPGRAGVLGNPSDMYGGTVISVAIRKRAYVAIEPAAELRLLSRDAQLSQLIAVRNDLALVPPPSAADLVHLTHEEAEQARRRTYLNVLKAVVVHQRWADRKAVIACWSEIPPNAGLTSSSALVAAALHATDRALGLSREPYAFAEAARYIEFNRLGVICGFQDFYAATFGGILYMDFRDKQDWRGPEIEPFATVERFDFEENPPPFVIANTAVARDSGATHRPLRERWLDRERKVVDGVEALGRLARQGKKCLIARDWDRLGQLMNENQRIIRELGGSGEANERLIQTALDLGSTAAKLAGAGQGGTIICLHPEPDALVSKLVAAGVAGAFAVGQAAAGVRSEAADALSRPWESASPERQSHPGAMPSGR